MPVSSSIWQRSAIARVFSIACGSSGNRRRHLGAALEIELIAGVAQPIRVVERLLRADAQQDVVGGGVVALQVVAVVGGHQRDAGAAGDVAQDLVGLALLRDAVVLHLEIEAVVAEDLAEVPAAASACSAWPASTFWLISPCRQADRPMMPSLCARRSSLSIRGR